MTETINGLHKCQPKNAPTQGAVKNMVVLNMPAKNDKKAWIKIKSEKPEKGGSPYRILNVEPLPWEPDTYGNIAFNIEVEATTQQPSAFQQVKSTMQGDHSNDDDTTRVYDKGQHMLEPLENTPQSPPHAQQGEDGVTEARKHLMRCCNLYNLCIAAVDKAIAPNMPVIAQTSEQFQATIASLWIEASGRRCTNGVDWWSYIDKMPDTPINGGKKTHKVCTCENTDGDNPLCPIHGN